MMKPMKRDTKIQIMELVIFDLFDQSIDSGAELHVEHKIVDMFKQTIDFNVETTEFGQYQEFKYTLPISEIDRCDNHDIYRFAHGIADHLLNKKHAGSVG